MDSFIISSSDSISITALEVKELLGKKSISLQETCIIPDCSAKDLAILAYHSQTAKRVGIVLARIPLKDPSSEKGISAGLEKLSEHIDKKLLLKISTGLKTFGAFVHKSKNQILSSPDIASMVGEELAEILKKSDISLSVNLTSPDLPVLSIIDGSEILIGVDLVNLALEKRPYKLMSHPSAINGSFAYTLVRLAGVKKGTFVLDPFCSTGTIIIETAMFQEGYSCFHFQSKFSGLKIPLVEKEFQKIEDELKKQVIHNKPRLYGYDGQVKMMLAAQKNAKIAGIHNAVKFSKASIDWIDAKFEKHEVECIITNPPKSSKRLGNEKKILKIYDDLFFQAEYLLKPGGTLAMLLIHEGQTIELAKKHHFTVKSSSEIHSGEQAYRFIIFTSKK